MEIFCLLSALQKKEGKNHIANIKVNSRKTKRIEEIFIERQENMLQDV